MTEGRQRREGLTEVEGPLPLQVLTDAEEDSEVSTAILGLLDWGEVTPNSP